MEPTVTKTDPNATIIRLLSTGAIISSAAFAKENPVKQTEILTLAAGKPIAFVENFNKLSDPKLLTKKLLTGEDVSMELEFNSIEMTDAEKKALTTIRPLLKRINKLKGGEYPWLSDKEIADARRSMTLRDNEARNSSGYGLTKAQVLRIWKLYSPWMRGETDVPASITIVVRYDRRTINFNPNGSLRIGCQTVTRAEAEAAFKHFGFGNE